MPLMNDDIKVTILREIRDEIRKTNGRLDETNGKLDQTNTKLDQTNSRIDETNSRIDQLRDDVIRRFTETEVRLATAITAHVGEVRRLVDVVEERREHHRDLDARVTRLEEHTGIRAPSPPRPRRGTPRR